jgi:hypothetical protein
MTFFATRVVLGVGLVAALLYAVENYFSDFHGDRGWPGSAAQIIATLLLAVVVEDRVLDRRNLREAARFKAVAECCSSGRCWRFCFARMPAARGMRYRRCPPRSSMAASWG